MKCFAFPSLQANLKFRFAQAYEDGFLRIVVKANASKDEILGWDDSKKALRISIKAAAEKGKANKEIVKFLSKILKKKVSIVSGFKSRQKLLKVE